MPCSGVFMLPTFSSKSSSIEESGGNASLGERPIGTGIYGAQKLIQDLILGGVI